MKIIALEESFSMAGLKSVASISNFPTPIDPKVMQDWEIRGRDFTQYRIPEMDANGVTMQILSLTVPGIQLIADPAGAIEEANLANDYLARAVADKPDRFRGFAALPLQNPEAAAGELRRCVNELGFCGALVNDTTLGQYLDESQFEPVWQALEDLQVPLYIHPGVNTEKWNLLSDRPELGGALWEWQARVGGHAMRLLLSGVFDRHPMASIVLGHMGEFLPFQTWRFDSRYMTLKEQRLKHLPSFYFGRNIFITTSGVFSPEVLAGAVQAIGEDAILFAIDYPYESSEDAVRFLKEAPVTEEAREKIAYKNAERLLRLR